jgi:transposase
METGSEIMSRKYEKDKEMNLKRLITKTETNALFIELCKNYGMPPIEAQALIEHLEALRLENNMDRTNGQILWYAIHITEPAGKPIKYCKKVKVKLTMFMPLDTEILLLQGSIALREVKLQRITEEAYRQGGLLSQEDLAALLCIDRDTVKRIIYDYKEKGILIPTRGQIKGIGRGPSHKVRIIQLFFKRYTISEIAVRTGHSVESVKEYIQNFSRVAVLLREGYKTNKIRKVTKLSDSLVKEYIKLYDQYNTPEFEDIVSEISAAFNGISLIKKEVKV